MNHQFWIHTILLKISFWKRKTTTARDAIQILILKKYLVRYSHTSVTRVCVCIKPYFYIIFRSVLLSVKECLFWQIRSIASDSSFFFLIFIFYSFVPNKPSRRVIHAALNVSIFPSTSYNDRSIFFAGSLRGVYLSDSVVVVVFVVVVVVVVPPPPARSRYRTRDARRWLPPRRLYKCAAPAGALSMCHALRARVSSVMAARVRLKMRRDTGVSPLTVLVTVFVVSSLVSGMFEHRHCDHQHPRAHEVSEALVKAPRRVILTSLSRSAYSCGSSPRSPSFLSVCPLSFSLSRAYMHTSTCSRKRDISIVLFLDVRSDIGCPAVRVALSFVLSPEEIFIAFSSKANVRQLSATDLLSWLSIFDSSRHVCSFCVTFFFLSVSHTHRNLIIQFFHAKQYLALNNNWGFKTVL